MRGTPISAQTLLATKAVSPGIAPLAVVAESTAARATIGLLPKAERILALALIEGGRAILVRTAKLLTIGLS